MRFAGNRPSGEAEVEASGDAGCSQRSPEPCLIRAAASFADILDLLRFEQTPIGPPNRNEFGSTVNRDEFETIYRVNSSYHIQDGTPYRQSTCLRALMIFEFLPDSSRS